jgi:hypothetical protein
VVIDAPQAREVRSIPLGIVNLGAGYASCRLPAKTTQILRDLALVAVSANFLRFLVSSVPLGIVRLGAGFASCRLPAKTTQLHRDLALVAMSASPPRFLVSSIPLGIVRLGGGFATSSFPRIIFHMPNKRSHPILAAVLRHIIKISHASDTLIWQVL